MLHVHVTVSSMAAAWCSAMQGSLDEVSGGSFVVKAPPLRSRSVISFSSPKRRPRPTLYQ